MKSNFVSNHFQYSPAGERGNGSKAMVLAAGLGTRLKPFTNTHPKALVVINGKSLLQRNIEYLQQYGVFNIIVNTHHFASQIEEAIVANYGWGSNVTISYEAQVLETGGGLKYAAPYFKDSNYFVLMNADVLTDMPLDKMIAQHVQQQPLATVATCSRNSSRYLLFDDDNQLCGWQNINTGQIKMARPAENYTQQAFSGIHIISNRFIDCLQSFEGKFSIIDVYLKYANNYVIQAFKHDDYLFIDVGKPESITVAENLFK
jgi:N-acetyl-alpha-D-muramate 1-phosphate uridylyltransferase